MQFQLPSIAQIAHSPEIENITSTTDYYCIRKSYISIHYYYIYIYIYIHTHTHTHTRDIKQSYSRSEDVVKD